MNLWLFMFCKELLNYWRIILDHTFDQSEYLVTMSHRILPLHHGPFKNIFFLLHNIYLKNKSDFPKCKFLKQITNVITIVFKKKIY